MIEIVLAVLDNLKVIGCIAGAAILFSAGAKFVHADVEHMFDRPKEKSHKASARKTFLIGLLCFGVLAVPSIHDLWSVRIALIKYELASPENVKSGAEAIGRIAEKLECKYLGCPEAKNARKD